jgi:hypothetical protein
MEELILRGASPVGELEDLRERLKHELLLEHKLCQHLKKLEHCSRLEQCLIVLLHKIPCIIHCENRVGLKLLSMLLREGFSNVQKGYLSLPYDAENKTVGVICLDNNRIRKILQEYELLVTASVYDRELSTKCNTSIQDYQSAMAILREKRKFTDEKIIAFQSRIDSWFQNWNELWSIEGCTNYTHMLSSGHMTEFMYKWRNLYRFSQQKIQSHIFHLLLSKNQSRGKKVWAFCKIKANSNWSMVAMSPTLDDRLQ